ncbi:MAG: hypothetical protein ACRD1N_03985 [Terriglobia bacterium]
MTGFAPDQIFEMERRLLAALCHQPELRESARTRLLEYAWREPVHQVIFQALISIPPGRQQDLQAELAARLTRRGFPDISWRDFEQPCKISEWDAEEGMQRLLENTR